MVVPVRMSLMRIQPEVAEELLATVRADPLDLEQPLDVFL